MTARCAPYKQAWKK